MHLIEAVHGISLLVQCQADMCNVLDKVLALLAQKGEEKILIKLLKDLIQITCTYLTQHSEHYKFLCPLV